MSSYYTSPFELERQRLQGIVSQCSRDLDAALQEVRRQEDHMEEQRRERAAADAAFKVKDKRHEQDYQREKAAASLIKSQKKKEMKKLLADADIEIRALQTQFGPMPAAQKRQQELTYRMQNAQDAFELLERDIRDHIDSIEEEARTLSRAMSKTDLYAGASYTKQSPKGVSLKIERQTVGKSASAADPLGLFTARMETVMASSFISRFPSAMALRSAFEQEPAYARAAFAARHMQKLEILEAQIRKLEEKEAAASKKREEDVQVYKALCKLLQMEADEELIRSEGSGSKLSQTCAALKRRYQEKKKHAYIASAVEQVMRRHGIEFQDASDLSGTSVMQFSMESASLSVSGLEHGRLTMEVSGLYSANTPTMNDRRKSVASARRFCSLMKIMEEELREEYGIVFRQVIAEEPSEETIRMQRDPSAAGSPFTETKKEMTLQKG